MVRRSGFGLAEVVVALVVLAVGALGAAALITHAALGATAATRREEAVRHALALLDSLADGSAPAGSGTRARAGAVYRWSVAGDTAVRVVDVSVVLRAPPDTIRLRAVRPPAPAVLLGAP